LHNLFMIHCFLSFGDMIHCFLSFGEMCMLVIWETTSNSNLLILCLKQSVSDFTLDAILTWISSCLPVAKYLHTNFF
jgi:hypothetical protein